MPWKQKIVQDCNRNLLKPRWGEFKIFSLKNIDKRLTFGKDYIAIILPLRKYLRRYDTIRCVEHFWSQQLRSWLNSEIKERRFSIAILLLGLNLKRKLKLGKTIVHPRKWKLKCIHFHTHTIVCVQEERLHNTLPVV